MGAGSFNGIEIAIDPQGLVLKYRKHGRLAFNGTLEVINLKYDFKDKVVEFGMGLTSPYFWNLPK